MREKMYGDFSLISWHCDIMIGHSWARWRISVKIIYSRKCEYLLPYTNDSFKHYLLKKYIFNLKDIREVKLTIQSQLLYMLVSNTSIQQE